jgi:DNA repair protein RecN (Recombination protein N)
VENTLKNLGIADGIFEINFSLNESDDETNSIPMNGKNFSFNSKGIDNVKFLISTNLGEDPKPLVKVASGGEVSRVMLSLKSVLAKSDKLPILIFDEIDTGVSGRIAQKVGQALKNLSSTHQIIAITHLPQIASLSDYHYSVEKLKIEDRVVSNIRALNQSEKINEIAKLISGEKITDSAIISAKELLGIN